MSAFDVAIIGGGVIGGSIAFELASHKVAVVVLDGQQPGRESSWAAAGMLSPGPDSPEAVPLVPLAKESMRLYPEFVSSVEEFSGRTIGFAGEGTLEIFPARQGDGERDRMVTEHRRLGLAAEPIALDAARKLEKSLGPAARAAAWLPEEATLDPRLLMEALFVAARGRGVEIRANCAVTAVLTQGNRVTGVMAGGEKISANFVVAAAGSFCGSIGGLAPFAPTRPVRGQMVALRSGDVALRRVLRSPRGYLVPRADGRIIAGSTLEDAGFQKHVTPSGIEKILDAALELIPGLAGAEIAETWAGLRPGTPDNLPILGPTDIEGLLIATGHYRNGILLAPVTAKLVRNWILREQVSLDASIFSPLRFREKKSHLGGPRSATAIS
jgi:glycine oxidase